MRPCIACNQGCIGNIQRGSGITCTVNAAAGFEGVLSEDLIVATTRPQDVLVVGGGPAGMEAARVAALAGHRVRLIEATSHLGGAARVASRQARTFSDILLWLERELERLHVSVQLNSFVEADEVLSASHRPDVVITATGSHARMDGYQPMAPSQPINGITLPHVLTTTDLLTANVPVQGTSALVFDAVGHFEAVWAALHLIQRGMSVTYATSARAFAPYVRTTLRDESLLEQLDSGEFSILVNQVLIEIGAHECVLRPKTGSRLSRVKADVVVVVTPNEPNRQLFEGLRGHISRLEIIGDALSPRDLTAAIREGHRVARSLH